MKAKEYVQKFFQASGQSGKDIIPDILTEFYEETVQLIESRGAKNDSAIFSVFDEMDTKWRCFVNKIKLPSHIEAYGLMVGLLFGKDIYERWMSYNEYIAKSQRKTTRERRDDLINLIISKKKMRDAILNDMLKKGGNKNVNL